MDALQDDDSGMICTEHPFKNTTPAGGICAFCLQEKLGKLVSSSFPITVFPSSSSSSPSFRSDTTTNVSTTITTTVPPNPTTNPTSSNGQCHYINQHDQHGQNKSRILYLLSHKKKKKNDITNINLKRSKSTANPRMRHAPGQGGALRYMEGEEGLSGSNKRGFWSFLYMQKHAKRSGISSNMLSGSQRSKENEMIIVEENDSPPQPSFDRKVSRSRSVGCGSRSFSGDFFERISTGFGDCTLRRVESNREGKKGTNLRAVGHDGECMKERVRCGGLFSGFMITSSSSSSSSSSYWVASNPNDVIGGNMNGKMMTSTGVGMTSAHGRSKSWGWALASPMRAFSKTSTTKKEGANNNNKNQTPNLSAIPSLLSVRS